MFIHSCFNCLSKEFKLFESDYRYGDLLVRCSNCGTLYKLEIKISNIGVKEYFLTAIEEDNREEN